MRANRDTTNEEHSIAPETGKRFPAPSSGDGAGADTSWAITADKVAIIAKTIKTPFKLSIVLCVLTQKLSRLRSRNGSINLNCVFS